MDKTKVPTFINTVTKFPHMCKSCGMCVGVCPTGALRMVLNVYNQFVPSYDENKCIHCQRCINCCPGVDITDFKPKSEREYEQLLIGHANNSTIREAGASGGVVTALMAWMLEKGIITKAISLSTVSSPIIPHPKIFTSPEAISRGGGSRYINYPLCDSVSEFDEASAVTTLPCQSLAMRRAGLTKGYIFGLFCSKAYTRDLIKFVCKKEALVIDEITRIDYRHGEWPGSVYIETPRKVVNIPYQRSYYTAASNGYYFVNQGCLLCPDYFNENADISFGDPWGLQRDDLREGKTVIVVRTEKGRRLIEQAKDDGIIFVEDLDRSYLAKGHKNGIHFKQCMLPIRLKKIQELGLPVPRHEVKVNIQTSWFDDYIQGFYINNVINLKNNYEEIFNWSKRKIFLKRFIIHFFQTLQLKVKRSSVKSE